MGGCEDHGIAHEAGADGDGLDNFFSVMYIDVVVGHDAGAA